MRREGEREREKMSSQSLPTGVAASSSSSSTEASKSHVEYVEKVVDNETAEQVADQQMVDALQQIKEKEVKIDEHGFVKLIDVMPRLIEKNGLGPEAAIVQAARISYGKIFYKKKYFQQKMLQNRRWDENGAK